MQFCKVCGGALNLFECNDKEVCWCCVQKQKEAQPPPQAALHNGEFDDLAGATFSCENETLALTAREGWVLWSGPLSQSVPFETIIKRARHIYRIRKKRLKNSDKPA